MTSQRHMFRERHKEKEEKELKNHTKVLIQLSTDFLG
jgi:hypothetical protein